jgi:hypothetical protein
MTNFHDQFKKQTKVITALSAQIQEMQIPTPLTHRRTKKAHLASDNIQPQLLDSSFLSQSPCHTKSPFSSQNSYLSPSQSSPIDRPRNGSIHMLE